MPLDDNTFLRAHPESGAQSDPPEANPLEKTMSRTPNDDRSDSMNPNNDAYDDAMDNHANQLNPNNDAYQESEDDD